LISGDSMILDKRKVIKATRRRSVLRGVGPIPG
jgi:hypothetical protein